MKAKLKTELTIIGVFMIAILNWFLDTSVLYLSFSVIAFLIILLFDFNRMHIIPLIFGYSIAFSNFTLGLFEMSMIGLLLVMTAYDIIKKKMKQINALIIGMVFWLIIMIGSLVHSIAPIQSFNGVAQMIGAIIVLFYIGNLDHLDKITPIFRCVMYLGFAILIQIIIYIVSHAPQSVAQSLSLLHLGWGSYNIISSMFLLIIPCVAFMYYKQRQWWLFIILLMNIALLILLATRGTYIAILIIAIPFMMLVYNNHPKPKRLLQATLIFMIVLLIMQLLIFIPTNISSMWYHRIASADQTNVLLALGLRAFQSNALFGSGVYTASIYIESISQMMQLSMHHYPSDIVEVLATTGVMGLAAYAMYWGIIIKHLVKQDHKERYLLLGVIALMIQGFFDASIYSFATMIVMTTLIASQKFIPYRESPFYQS